MAAKLHWHLAALASCVMMMVTSSPIEGQAGEEAKENEKRSGQYCNVNGYYYRHGEIFSMPGYSRCIKYRCNNGGWSVAQSACERNSRCIPVGSVIREGCRSLHCKNETRGNMNYYSLEPTAQDMCDAEGQCVPKNRDFTHKDCQTYRCIETPNGGYYFQINGAAKCKDDNGNCVNVGARYSKWVNGRFYRNCMCLHGGGYSCRG